MTKPSRYPIIVKIVKSIEHLYALLSKILKGNRDGACYFCGSAISVRTSWVLNFGDRVGLACGRCRRRTPTGMVCSDAGYLRQARLDFSEYRARLASDVITILCKDR